MPLEVEEVEQVSNGRAVSWGVQADRRIVSRVGQVVAAAARHRRQVPVVLDEIEQRHVIIIRVPYCAVFGVVRDPDERYAATVAKVVQNSAADLPNRPEGWRPWGW